MFSECWDQGEVSWIELLALLSTFTDYGAVTRGCVYYCICTEYLAVCKKQTGEFTAYLARRGDVRRMKYVVLQSLLDRVSTDHELV